MSAPTVDAAAVKVLNRADLTKRLVAKLTRDEAVVAGIGNTNFDLYAAGHRPQNFYMLGSMGLACPIALGVALAQPERGVIALEGDGSILMALGCLATIGDGQAAQSHHRDHGQRPLPDHRQAGGRDRAQRRHRGDRARRRHRGQPLGARRGAFRATDRRGASTTAGRCCWRRRSTTSPGSGRPRATPRSSATASCAGSAPGGQARSTRSDRSGMRALSCWN